MDKQHSRGNPDQGEFLAPCDIKCYPGPEVPGKVTVSLVIESAILNLSGPTGEETRHQYAFDVYGLDSLIATLEKAKTTALNNTWTIIGPQH